MSGEFFNGLDQDLQQFLRGTCGTFLGAVLTCILAVSTLFAWKLIWFDSCTFLFGVGILCIGWPLFTPLIYYEGGRKGFFSQHKRN